MPMKLLLPERQAGASMQLGVSGSRDTRAHSCGNCARRVPSRLPENERIVPCLRYYPTTRAQFWSKRHTSENKMARLTMTEKQDLAAWVVSACLDRKSVV